VSLENVQSQFDFDDSRRRAFWRDVRALLRRESRTLLSLDAVMRAARLEGKFDRGITSIPVERIKGSESKVADFDALFLPASRRQRDRWAHLDALIQYRGVELPPIDVYQVGETYFVRDGHYRVSVAKYLGWATIKAHVVEVTTRIPLSGELAPEELLRAQEYARFLDQTELDRLRPEARLECSRLGRYDILLEHILGHRYFLGQARAQEVPLPEAAASWFDAVFRPITSVVEKYRIPDRLPGRTRADIYLAVTRHWLELSRAGDSNSGPEAAAAALIAEIASDEVAQGLAKAMRRWMRRRPHLSGLTRRRADLR
jgi:hypothetical protein